MLNMEDSGIDSGDTKVYKNEEEKTFSTSDSSSGSNASLGSPRVNCSGGVVGSSTTAGGTAGYSNKQLARRLEQRIESARRLHRAQEYRPPPHLIPIQRLPIPPCKEQQPLVEWDTEDSEEDIVNFFPVNRSKEGRAQQELTDTFSIEEMSISGAEDEEDDLHLVPPHPVYKRFGCCPHIDKCTLM